MEVVEHFKENVHNFAIDVPIGTTTGGEGSQESEVPTEIQVNLRHLDFLPVISRPLPIPPLD